MEKIAVTGASGLIGGILTDKLTEYNYYLIDRIVNDQMNIEEESSHFIQLDLSLGFEDLISIFKHADVVIHLAASGYNKDRKSIIRDNYIGTYNVFLASLKAKVKRIIFFSSNNVTKGYEREEPYAHIVKGEYKKVKRPYRLISVNEPFSSDSLYSDSKVYGEEIGKKITEKSGISVICLRIGTVNLVNQPIDIRNFATFLSHDDLVQLIERSISAPLSVRFLVVYGVSDNKWRFWDIENARNILGFKPEDDAEIYRSKFRLQHYYYKILNRIITNNTRRLHD